MSCVEREHRTLGILREAEGPGPDRDRAGELGAAELLHPGESCLDVIGAEVDEPIRLRFGRQRADAAVYMTGVHDRQVRGIAAFGRLELPADSSP